MKFKPQKQLIDAKPKKILFIGTTIGLVLLSLLGGIALVVRSLRNVNLNLFLELKSDDTADRKH